MNIIEEITELTKQWYTLIGSDHHKDKDCHWYAETRWSYGDLPKYTVWHNGYILDKIEEECDSYDEALLKLKEILIEKIEEEKKNKEENNEDGW